MHCWLQKEAARQQLLAQLTPKQRSFFANRRRVADQTPAAGSRGPSTAPPAHKAAAQHVDPDAQPGWAEAAAGPQPAPASKVASASAPSRPPTRLPADPLGPELPGPSSPQPETYSSSVAAQVRFDLAGEPCGLQQGVQPPAAAAVLRDPLRCALICC